MNTYYNDDSQAFGMRLSDVMRKVYVKMFFALLLSAAVAFGVGITPGITMFLATHSFVYWGLLLAELGIVFYLSARLQRISSATASAMFYIFAIINGLVMALIFSAFSFTSIFKTFVITAGVFGAMSVYGYFTNRDLTRFGSFLMMALIGLIIASLVNIFWGNSTLEWIISFAGVFIFIGLTAWDTQQIKNLAMTGMMDNRLATIGALSLYLDFINLFLYLLRFFGSSRD